MFSIFEYLRRRVCDSFLAGAYDAIEILETEKMKLPLSGNEVVSDASISEPVQPSTNGQAPKVLSAQTPPARPTSEAKPVASTEKKAEQKSATPTTKPAAQPTTTSVQATPSSPPANLFTERDAPLPPRRRGRPRKNRPDGNSQ
jgi:hypothetical protein